MSIITISLSSLNYCWVKMSQWDQIAISYEGQILTNSSKPFSIIEEGNYVCLWFQVKCWINRTLAYSRDPVLASVAGQPTVQIGEVESRAPRCRGLRMESGRERSAACTEAPAPSPRPLPAPSRAFPGLLFQWTGCSVSYLLRVLRCFPAPWQGRRHPRGDGQGAPGGWPGRCRAPVGAGRTRLPSVEETRPCGDGCQGRSFTPEAGGAATAVSAHRELSLSPPPAASLHPARWRTEEKGGRMNPLGIPGRARTGPGRRAAFIGSLPALLGSRAARCGRWLFWGEVGRPLRKSFGLHSFKSGVAQCFLKKQRSIVFCAPSTSHL